MKTLYLVSTPIGNLEDITVRAIKILLATEIILCEDTRKTGLLISELAKRYQCFTEGLSICTSHKFIRFDEHLEFNKIPEIIDLLVNHDVALVSDAGTPLVSDPGFKLVSQCPKYNIKVISIPGASAVLTALTSSGLPTDKFLFLGYPPEKSRKRLNLLKELKDLPRNGIILFSTVLFYISPHKLSGFLKDISDVFGDTEITVARELTKIHEEIWFGHVSDAQTYFTHPKGEFVLLFKLD